MAKKRTEKTMSLRGVKTEAAICRLPRDHYNVRNWSIMTDGYRVWISQQKMGERRTDHVEVPKKIFDRLFDAYAKPQKIVRA